MADSLLDIFTESETVCMCGKVGNLAANCTNLKQDSSRAAEQCLRDQQMLAELHDKYHLLRLDKGDNVVASLLLHHHHHHIYFSAQH